MSSRESRYVDLGPQIPSEPRRLRQVSPMGGEDPRETMAKRVRQIYVALYRRFKDAPTYGDNPIPQFDGGQDRFGTNRTAVWPKVAKHIADIGADPILYMQSQFYGRAADHVPLPNALCNAQAVCRYEGYADDAAYLIANRLKHDIDSIEAHVLPMVAGGQYTQTFATRDALYNVVMVTATPLMRYCVALREGIDDAADYFFRRALTQYAFQKESYDSVFRDLIPESLQDEASMLREQLFGRDSYGAARG